MLVDPWFVGDLVFLEQEWLYRGIKREVGKSVKPDYQQIAQQADVLVLTQVGIISSLEACHALPFARC